MKKLAVLMLGLCLTLGVSAQTQAQAQKQDQTEKKAPAVKKAEIKFDQTMYDFGRFPESSPVQTCKFYFTNTGNDLLVIHQAVASCGCTVPKYSKEPIRPGERGSITVTYDGRGKVLGTFRKSITLRTNAKTEMVRIYIQGEMEEK
ncbi:MAG: DUF1573 domain-containing protein [Bacteroidaceae bacterium]|nr:DUF1573 domain-containing protein [Bacteroidaceae bacterium]